MGDITPGNAGRIADRESTADNVATERERDEAIDRAAFDAGAD